MTRLPRGFLRSLWMADVDFSLIKYGKEAFTIAHKKASGQYYSLLGKYILTEWHKKFFPFHVDFSGDKRVDVW